MGWRLCQIVACLRPWFEKEKFAYIDIKNEKLFKHIFSPWFPCVNSFFKSNPVELD